MSRERELDRARESAVLTEYSGMVKALKITRILGWLCALVPIIGAFGVAFLAGLIPAVGFIYLAVQGAKKFAVKQILITIGAVMASIFVWGIINIAVLTSM
ncbi:MAG: hypothetical protein ACRER5_02920 [Pseudomonas sp.]